MGLFDEIQNSVRPDFLWSHLEWFNDVRRDTGGPGEDAACEYIVGKLKEYGVPVRVHEFSAFLSYPRSATLEVSNASGSITVKCLTHSFCQSTGPEGVTGQLYYVSDADASKTGGKIALLDGLLSPIKVLEASKSGATALIFSNEDRVIHNMIGTTIWGTPTFDQLDRLPNLPVISINKTDGDLVKSYLDAGPVQVRIVTEVETGWYVSKLPEAIIEGTDDADKFVMVGAHYCAWEVGITDNATGDAALLEMARILMQHRSQLKRSIRFCWWPGHSHGRYSGSTWYADTFYNELSENCVAYHNIDSPGVKGATMYVARHTSAEIEGFCRECISDLTGQENIPVHRPSRAADQSFLAVGIPSFSCYPFLPLDHPDRRPWTGGCGNALWWHSSEDTLDKADREILALDTRISATAVARLCTVPVLPFDFSLTANETLRFVDEFVREAKDHMNTEPLVVQMARFDESIKTLTEQVGISDGLPPEEQKHLNDLLMRLGRLLGHVIFGKGGPYAHEPAEWSPIMRNVKTSSFPGLNNFAALSALQGTYEYGFLRAGLVRQMNRLTCTLRDSVDLIEQSRQNLKHQSVT